MYTGKTLFAQIMDYLPWKSFHRIVSCYDGDHRIRTLPCAEHFRILAFAQLTYRESLRDIEACLSAQSAKLYHMGIRSTVKRSTLADANERRDWRIYAEFAHRLIATGPQTLRRRRSGLGFVEYGLRSRFDDDRPVSVVVSMGAVSKHQDSGQDAYAAGLAGQYPEFYTCLRWQTARCQLARYDDPGASGYLRAGSCLSGFRSAFWTSRSRCILRHLCQVECRPPTHLFHIERSRTRNYLRSDGCVVGLLQSKTLPPSFASNPFQRSRIRENAHLSDQPVRPSADDDLRVVQSSLAGRIVFQMDQTAPAHQTVLRQLRERSESLNLDRRVGVRACRYYQEVPQPGYIALHFASGIFSHPVGENPLKQRLF